jgi:cytoskeleton protein RodZ
MFELGNNLREARHRRQIDLVAAEQDTKIRSKYLSALETEDFDILPGPVFVRGFLRTYSQYLGLDAQLFIDEYNARFGRFEEVEDHASPALGRPGLAQERVSRGRRTMRTVAIVTVVAVAGLAWLGLREEPSASDSTGTPTRTTDAPNPPAVANADALSEAASAATSAPSMTTPAARSASTDGAPAAK